MRFDAQYFLSSKHAKFLIIGLITLFSLLILAEFSSLFLSAPPTLNSSISSDKIPQPVKKKTVDFVLNSSLFGVYLSNDLQGDQVKQSLLNIVLVGILLGHKEEDSQVIIRSANGEEKNYKINDKIPGGVLIKRIMSGGILVEHRGSLEKVSLPNDKLTFEPVAKPLRNN